MLEKNKNTLLENDLKESKKYVKNIMSEITTLLDNYEFTYSENDSKTEIVVDDFENVGKIRSIIKEIDIDRRLLEILISTDIIDNKVFIRLITN